eukprot:jgi/Astpho2/4508/fgenesh1_pg.00067_%23_81_t
MLRAALRPLQLQQRQELGSYTGQVTGKAASWRSSSPGTLHRAAVSSTGTLQRRSLSAGTAFTQRVLLQPHLTAGWADMLPGGATAGAARLSAEASTWSSRSLSQYADTRYHTEGTLRSGHVGGHAAEASGQGSPSLGAYFSGRSVQSGLAGRLSAEASGESPFMLHQLGAPGRSGPAAGRLSAEAPAVSPIMLHQPAGGRRSGPAAGRSGSLRSFNLELEHSQAASDAGSLCAESAPSEAALQQGDEQQSPSGSHHSVERSLVDSLKRAMERAKQAQQDRQRQLA